MTSRVVYFSISWAFSSLPVSDSKRRLKCRLTSTRVMRFNASNEAWGYNHSFYFIRCNKLVWYDIAFWQRRNYSFYFISPKGPNNENKWIHFKKVARSFIYNSVGCFTYKYLYQQPPSWSMAILFIPLQRHCTFICYTEYTNRRISVKKIALSDKNKLAQRCLMC